MSLGKTKKSRSLDSQEENPIENESSGVGFDKILNSSANSDQLNNTLAEFDQSSVLLAKNHNALSSDMKKLDLSERDLNYKPKSFKKYNIYN